MTAQERADQLVDTPRRRLTEDAQGDGASPERAQFSDALGRFLDRPQAAHRATAELSELSAGCGVGLFALVWAGKGSLIARNLVGGSGELPAALGRHLGERARTRCRVHAVEADGEHLIVHHTGGEVRARHVIVAARAPYAAPSFRPSPGRRPRHCRS